MDFIKFLPYYLKDETSAVALFAALQDLMQDNADDFYTIIRDLLIWNVDNNSTMVNRALAQMIGLYGYSKLQSSVRDEFLKIAKKITGKTGVPWSIIKMAEGCLDQTKIIGGVNGWVQEGDGGARYNSQYYYDGTINYDSEFHINKFSVFVPYIGGSAAVSSTEDDNARAVATYYKRAKNELYTINYPYLETGLVDSLEAFYPLFENYNACGIKDCSGNDRDGFLYNAQCADLNAPGASLEFGEVFDFSKDSDAYVLCEDAIVGDYIGSGAFSIFGVFYFDGTAHTDEYMITVGSAAGKVELIFDSSLYFTINDGVNNSYVYSDALTTGWHSFCATYDYSGTGAGINIYIDGATDIAGDSINTINDFTTSDIYIGSGLSGSETLSLPAGHFRFYSAEATPAQISNIHNGLLS